MNDPEIEQWLDLVSRRNYEKINESSMFLQLVSEDIDPLMALQLGYALLMDKPLIFVVMPGAKVPEHLIRAADAIMEYDEDPAKMSAKLNPVISEILQQEADE